MSSRDTYHHGDLKATILAEAAVLVAERGADGLSLRELARAAGVSHAAPAHHFTDRRGLFTALATEGFQHARRGAQGRTAGLPGRGPGLCPLRDRPSRPLRGDVRQVALRRRRPESRRRRNAAGAELAAGVGTLDDPRATNDPQAAALAAWSLVHGFSLLWLNNAIDNDADPMATVHRVAGMLFGT